MRILRRFNLFCSTVTSVLLIVTGPGVQRYVRTYVESGIIGVYVSIVLVYALILFGGGGGGGGAIVFLFLRWVCWLFSACVSVDTYCYYVTY